MVKKTCITTIILLVLTSLSFSQKLFIKGGTIVTVNGETLKNYSIIVENGLIKGLTQEHTVKEGFKVIDAKGLYIYPGLIAPFTSIGLTGYPGTRSDQNESGIYTPQIDPADAINPEDNTVETTRIAGVTTVMTSAGSRNIVNGKTVILELEGSLAQQMIYKSNHGQVFNLGVKQKKSFPTTTAGAISFLREKLHKALNYKTSGTKRDQKMEALKDVVTGRVKAFFIANNQLTVRNSIKIIRDFRLDGVIISRGGILKHLDNLKRYGIPVIWSGTMTVPKRWQTFDHYYRMASEMEKRGVNFCFTSTGFGSGSYTAGNIPVPAAMSIAHGLSEKTAIKAMTINTAKILGISSTHGSIEKGKTANLVIWTGNPIQMRSKVKTVIIRGEIIPITSIQTRLRDKYQKILEDRKNRK